MTAKTSALIVHPSLSVISGRDDTELVPPFDRDHYSRHTAPIKALVGIETASYRAALRHALAQMGVETVVVSYSGSDHQGEIDEVQLLGRDGEMAADLAHAHGQRHAGVGSGRAALRGDRLDRGASL